MNQTTEHYEIFAKWHCMEPEQLHATTETIFGAQAIRDSLKALDCPSIRIEKVTTTREGVE